MSKYEPGPGPQWAMREAHQGTEVRYYTSEQLHAYAVAEVAREVARERERWKAELLQRAAAVEVASPLASKALLNAAHEVADVD